MGLKRDKDMSDVTALTSLIYIFIMTSGASLICINDVTERVGTSREGDT